MTELSKVLREGAGALGVDLDDLAVDRLLRLLDLLEKWNAVYSLTALPGKASWVTAHLLDSLSIAPHLRGSDFLDVGSGPGFPGLPLAIARPDMRWTLLDSNQKKTAFASQVVAELKLTNVTVVNARVENFRPATRFDAVVSRAFSDLGDFVRLTTRLVRDAGWLVAMKGRMPEDELGRIDASRFRLRVEPLAVPGLEGERHLVFMQPVGSEEAKLQ